MAKILYVEPESSCNYLLTEYLKDEHQILSVSRGQEALDFLKNNKVDIILTGISMPKMDGYTLAGTLKKKRINVPIIAISSLSIRDFNKDNLFDRIVMKPIDFDELKKAIIELLK